MNPNLSSALMYAHLNFKVFPLIVNSKNVQVLKSRLNERQRMKRLYKTGFLILVIMSVLELVMG